MYIIIEHVNLILKHTGRSVEVFPSDVFARVTLVTIVYEVKTLTLILEARIKATKPKHPMSDF